MSPAPHMFVFAGGGTGGHLFPGLAVASELQARYPEVGILFAGSNRTIETGILANTGFGHLQQNVEPLAQLRKRPWKFAVYNWRAFRDALSRLRQVQPAAVVGLGGYASAPVLLAARHLGIPTVLLEQNVVPGRATRWFASGAAAICVAFEETANHLPAHAKVLVTGNPVREPIAALAERGLHGAATCTSQHGSAHRLNVLVLGGSQGARSVNGAVLSAFEQLGARAAAWSIVHQTGQQDVGEVAAAYRRLNLSATVTPFLHDMAAQYAAASLVISRAGATTLAELACAGLPAILMPYPHAANNHQYQNARVFARTGAAIIVDDRPETAPAQLARQLEFLSGNPAACRQMSEGLRRLARPQARTAVAEELLNLAEVRDTSRRTARSA